VETNSKNDTRFTVEERRTLATLPWIVGIAVSTADKAGDQRTEVAEIHTMREAIEAAIASFSSATMIDLVIEHSKTTYATAGAEVISRCQQALELITKKGTEQEVEEYKKLVMEVADEVARAASEAFAGIGPKVSAKEKAMIDRIATVLQATKYTRGK
jgi:hypothetical protein